MEVEINMINVEDGDAIIIMLTKGNEKALILIDGGYERFYKNRFKKRLDQVLTGFKNSIDLVIGTHYDNDHLEGFNCLIQDYHDKIQKIWLHKAKKPLNSQITEMKSAIKLLLEKNTENLNKKVKNSNGYTLSQITENYQFLIKVLENIKKFNMEEKVEEVYAGCKLKGFENFEVISPTESYYNANLQSLSSNKLFNEIRQNNLDRGILLESFKEYSQNQKIKHQIKLSNPCNNLETSSISNNVTATNMISIVTLLSIDEQKYLFTGDAGIETFEQNIPNWKKRIDNIFWLDVPHHGSKNNISKNMLDVFSPQCVFISGNNGTNRPHSLLKSCLSLRNIPYEITNSCNNTWYLKYNNKGEFTRVHDI